MNYKIVSLQASNFKNLKAVSITPDGNVVTLTGPNGAGKSAILDAMQAVLAGKNGTVERPIRQGANDSDIVIDLGNGLVAKRRYTQGGSTLKIEQAGEDGPKKSPQALLDTLISNNCFDPLAFTLLKPHVQRDTLLRLLGIDTVKLDNDRASYYAARTEAGREKDKLTSQLCDLAPTVADAPKEPVSTADLLKELHGIQAHNINVENAKAAAVKARQAVEAAEKSVKEAEANIAAWQAELTKRSSNLAAAETQHRDALLASDKIAHIPTAPVNDKLVNVDKANAAYYSNKARADKTAELDAVCKRLENLNKVIDQIDNDKAKLIREAKMPIEGLSFDDAGVLYNGLPLSQASTGHRIRVSVAIGMALNPNVRVLFVRDGSLLDSEGLRVIAEMAEKHDFQIWIEDARSTDPAAIVIEDGEVKPS